jgi:hypothetical protein
MTLKTRLARLEADVGGDDDLTLEEIVEYSFRNKPDPAFEERLARSTLGKLLTEAARRTNEAYK